MRKHRALGTWAVLAVVLAAAGYAVATQAGGQPGGPRLAAVRAPRGPGYLALGDSIAFGFRPGGDYLNPAGFTGYPEIVAAALGLTVANAACPGETSASMINVDWPDNGCARTALGGPGYRIALPLHVSYGGAQLGYAVRYLRQHPDTRLVTVGIGANDMFRCQETTADRCGGAAFARTLAAVRRNLGTILGALRDQAHYPGTLVVVTYYARDYADPISASQAMQLNAVITSAASPFTARIADGYSAFKAAAADGDPCAAGLLVRLPHGGCDVHPSARGQQVLAAAVERAMAPPAP